MPQELSIIEKEFSPFERFRYKGMRDKRYVILETLDGKGFLYDIEKDDFVEQVRQYSIGNTFHSIRRNIPEVYL